MTDDAIGPLLLDAQGVHRLKRQDVEDRLVAELERIDPFDAVIIAFGVAIRMARRAGMQRHGLVRYIGEIWDSTP